MLKAMLSEVRLDPVSAFESSELQANLARRTARGGAVALVFQGMRLALNVLGIGILARLLSPEDFGLVGMVTVVVGFAQVFRDAGLTAPTVQQPDLTREQLSSVLWANMMVLAAVGVAIALGAPLVGAFYREPRLVSVTVILAGAFIINGLSVQHEALLRRNMRFFSLALSQIASQVLGLVAMIALAVWGWRYWSLVGGTLVTGLSSTVIVFVFCPWLPGRMRKGVGAGRMLRSGMDMMGLNFFNYFARNTDSILIGRFLGAAPVGLYSKAFQVSMLPMSQIRVPLVEVALPVLSTLTSDAERYRKYFRAVVETLSLVALPIGMYFAFEGAFVVRVVLGSGWSGAVPVFRILSLAGILQAIMGTYGLALMSHGYTRKYLKIGVVNGVVIIGALAVGVHWGIVGVATGYAVANAVVFLPTVFVSLSGTPVSGRDFVAATLRPGAYSLVALLVGLVMRESLHAPYALLHTAVAVAFAAIYLLAAWRDQELRGTIAATLKHVGLKDVFARSRT